MLVININFNPYFEKKTSVPDEELEENVESSFFYFLTFSRRTHSPDYFGATDTIVFWISVDVSGFQGLWWYSLPTF